MTINTTPAKIDIALTALRVLGAAKLPAKAAYSVSKLAKACDNQLRDFHTEREKIFTAAGCTKEVVPEKKAQDGSPMMKWVHPDPGELAAAIKETDALADVDVELAGVLPLDIEQFGNAELPGHAFYGLDWAMKPDNAAG